jgi:cell division protein FtsX
MDERLNRLEREHSYLKWAGALVFALMVALVLMSRNTTARYQIASPRDAFFVHRLDTSDTGLGRPRRGAKEI